MKLIFPHILIILITLSNCGFKVIKQSADANLNISKIVSEGDRRIGYQIKNKLAFYSQENSSNLSELNLEIIKEKKIKEKNIKNEITKYQITLASNIEFFLIKGNIKDSFSKSVTGDFITADSYSTTINNEKKIIDNLIESLSEEILDEIVVRLSDL